MRRTLFKFDSPGTASAIYVLLPLILHLDVKVVLPDRYSLSVAAMSFKFSVCSRPRELTLISSLRPRLGVLVAEEARVVRSCGAGVEGEEHYIVSTEQDMGALYRVVGAFTMDVHRIRVDVSLGVYTLKGAVYCTCVYKHLSTLHHEVGENRYGACNSRGVSFLRRWQ